MMNEQAATEETMQSFDINLDFLHKLYIVGADNNVERYAQLSELLGDACAAHVGCSSLFFRKLMCLSRCLCLSNFTTLVVYVHIFV